MARRRFNVFSLSFLDAMTCGFGAVVLFYMVINASVGLRTDRLTVDLRAETDRMEVEVLDAQRDLVELRNARDDADRRAVEARGLARRLLERLETIRDELATYDDTTIARREHIERLKADLLSLEQDTKRLSAAMPSDETPGDRLRSFIGDGQRQYLTGLKVGGKRIFILVDASASMLGDTVVNVIRRRNLPDEVKLQADKWRQAVATVDWLTTQIPRDSEFQVYTFGNQAGPVVPETRGKWLDGGDREQLDRAVAHLRSTVPEGGTSLYHGLAAARSMNPPPDNLILLVDGLPTRGEKPPKGRTVTGKQRVRLFNRAVEQLGRRTPVNVILFPMEGDPMAASAFWILAMNTGGSYLCPPGDWP